MTQFFLEIIKDCANGGHDRFVVERLGVGDCGEGDAFLPVNIKVKQEGVY